jgi:hypothetical protein
LVIRDKRARAANVSNFTIYLPIEKAGLCARKTQLDQVFNQNAPPPALVLWISLGSDLAKGGICTCPPSGDACGNAIETDLFWLHLHP